MLHPDPKAKAPKSTKNRVPAFKQKCNAVLAQLGIPTTLYAATGKDIYRKPRAGMWTELKDDYDLSESDIDHENSVFVGDAGGRTAGAAPKDFSCSDRNLAHNIGIKYQTPEEFFLGEEPRDFKRDFDLGNFPFAEKEDDDIVLEKPSGKDIVLFVGSPGAGKSTFYWKHLKPLGYERVNQDILKRSAPPLAASRASLTRGSKDKCFKAASDFLNEGYSVVIGTLSWQSPQSPLAAEPKSADPIARQYQPRCRDPSAVGKSCEETWGADPMRMVQDPHAALRAQRRRAISQQEGIALHLQTLH